MNESLIIGSPTNEFLWVGKRDVSLNNAYFSIPSHLLDHNHLKPKKRKIKKIKIKCLFGGSAADKVGAVFESFTEHQQKSRGKLKAPLK